MHRLAALFLASFALVGCLSAPTAERVVANTKSLGGDAAERIATDPTQLRLFLADKTIRSYDRGHGNQVEFIARDGTVWLWYPGNAIVLPGEWKTQPLSASGGTSLCFRYGTNTRNPVTGVVGAVWQCSDGADWLRDTPEIVDGDPLKLRRTRPFELTAHPETSLARLADRADLGPIPAKNHATNP